MLDNRIYTFLAVCQEMNFTKAARKLHITQPAVSQHIQYIERYYGVHAFHFEGKKLSLTPEGELLRSSLLTMKNNEDSLKTALCESVSRTPPLRLGATLTAGSFLLADPLAKLFRRWPDLPLTVTVKIIIHPHSGWFFLFGHSPNTTSYAQVRLFIGLPATRGITCYP